MEYKEISYKNEEEWHNIRQKHIGGSDCSIIMGHNPYNEDIQELWRKTKRYKRCPSSKKWNNARTAFKRDF